MYFHVLLKKNECCNNLLCLYVFVMFLDGQCSQENGIFPVGTDPVFCKRVWRGNAIQGTRLRSQPTKDSAGGHMREPSFVYLHRPPPPQQHILVSPEEKNRHDNEGHAIVLVYNFTG